MADFECSWKADGGGNTGQNWIKQSGHSVTCIKPAVTRHV